jgi:hypothetical protein
MKYFKAICTEKPFIGKEIANSKVYKAQTKKVLSEEEFKERISNIQIYSFKIVEFDV